MVETLKLIVECEGTAPTPLELPPGEYGVGAGETNAIVIDDPTVSARHCVLRVYSDGTLEVQDAGSTNGTWMEGRRVDRVTLQPGQSVNLGAARLLHDTLAQVPLPPPLRPAASLPAPSPPRPLPPPRQVPNRSFVSQIPGAFAYLFKGDAWLYPVIVLAIELFQGLLPGVVGIFGWIVGIAIGCYLVTIWRQVILSTIDGEDRFPDFPQVSLDWNENLRDYLRFAALALACFGPASLSFHSFHGPAWASYTLLVAGFAYFPMALLAFVLTDSLDVLSPPFIVRSIARAVPDYLWLLGAVAVLVAVGHLAPGWATQALMSSAQPSPRWLTVLARSCSTLFDLYTGFVGTRLLDLLYRSHRDRLAWV